LRDTRPLRILGRIVTRAFTGRLRDHLPTLGVFAVAAVVLLGWLGGYGLWDPDEGRHAAIARELFAATTWRGWLLPSHNFEPYYDKPILYYWLTGLAYAGIGVNEAGARLVSALAALGTLLAVFRWTAVVANVATARRAVLVLATSLGFVSLGRYGSLDMLLTCWITIGLCCAERFLADPSRTSLLVGAAVSAGLGMLTKGLVAPLFIAGIPLVYAVLAGRPLPRHRAWLTALGVFSLVAGPWYAVAGILDPTYLRNRYRDAYWAWVDASLGKVPRPSDVFARQLPCAYVMSDRDHGGFLDLAASDPGLEQILANDQAVLFRVKRDRPPVLQVKCSEVVVHEMMLSG